MESPTLVIVGAGGHAASVANVAISAGFIVQCYVDPDRRGKKLLGIPIVGDLSECGTSVGRLCCIAIGDNAVRERCYQQLSSKYPGLLFPALVHLSAVVSVDATVGEGAVVMPTAVIGPKTRVGRFCIINTRASIDHDGEMEDFASLAPGVVTGGGVHIGARSALGLGAVVLHARNVGSDTVVGASALVNQHIPSNCVAYGIPARVVRKRSAGDRYLD